MKQQKGFTLIELVIVIIILGILAAIAVPRYIDLSQSATDAARLGMEGSVKSAYAIAIADLKTNPTVTQINDKLATNDTTPVSTGIRFVIGDQPYVVQTYTDANCTTATGAVGATVLCVGSATTTS